MQDGKKKRLSMLDHLVVSGTPAPAAAPAMMSTNRALRSARDAVDSHRVWELDPAQIEDTRFKDRLDPGDVADLRASIEANGQTVPILVRRHPQDADRYLLVYGRRRLEAIRSSDRVTKVRALIASLDDGAAVRAQVAENTARRDLSYIERALFAKELLDTGFGNQSQIAEVLNTTKSAISMAVSVANGVGQELAQAIGPAHTIGRPRWEALIGLLDGSAEQRASLVNTARIAHSQTYDLEGEGADDPSTKAFHLVMKQAAKAQINRTAAAQGSAATRARVLKVDGVALGKIKRLPKGLRLDLEYVEPDFLTWFEASAEAHMQELIARWKARD